MISCKVSMKTKIGVQNYIITGRDMNTIHRQAEDISKFLKKAHKLDEVKYTIIDQ